MTKFKEESTPVQFSTATSLSSLTIDDDGERNGVVDVRDTQNVNVDNGSEKRDEVREKKEVSLDFSEDFDRISENEEEDKILADCISVGMQKNRYLFFLYNKLIPFQFIQFLFNKIIFFPIKLFSFL